MRNICNIIYFNLQTMKYCLKISFLFLALLSSCKTETGNKNILKSTVKNPNGETLVMEFDTIKDIAYITYDGKLQALTTQKPASGMWYKNEHFELRGKGEDVKLLKDGKIVFSTRE